EVDELLADEAGHGLAGRAGDEEVEVGAAEVAAVAARGAVFAQQGLDAVAVDRELGGVGALQGALVLAVIGERVVGRDGMGGGGLGALVASRQREGESRQE